MGRPGRDAQPDGQKGDQRSPNGRSQDDRVPERRPQARPHPARGLPVVRDQVQGDFVSACSESRDEPTDLRVVCLNRRLRFHPKQALPILAVDEPIYRRLPCFMIATVDKFAAMPWTGEVGSVLRQVRPLRPARILWPVRAESGPTAAGAALTARPDHPGRAAPDLRAAGHDGRALRDGPR